MKLGFFITTMNHGGAERVMSILTDNFALNGHEVHLFIYNRHYNYYELNPSVIVHYLDPKISRPGKLQTVVNQYNGLAKAKKIINYNKLDCLIGFTTFVNCTTIILGKLTNTPVIISERNDPVSLKPRILTGLVRKRLYKHADSIVLQTERSKKSFDVLNVKLPKQKVIFNPIAPNFFDKALERGNIITVVGRLSFEKGHDLLFKAFANSKFGNWKLHLVGDGVERSNLMQLANKLNIEEALVWHGVQNNIEDFLNQSAIYILPSRTEGFPNALCEAMACGCAVISFDCPNGPDEIIENEKNGLLVTSEDVSKLTEAIDRLIGDSAFRNYLGNEAAKITDKLNENAIFLKWKSLINSTIDAKHN